MMDAGIFSLVRAALGSLAASTVLLVSRDRLAMVLGGRCSPYRTHQGVEFTQGQSLHQGTLVANCRFVAVLYEDVPGAGESSVSLLPEAPEGLEWVGGAVPSRLGAFLSGYPTNVGWPVEMAPLIWVQVLRRKLARWDGPVPVWANTPGGLPPWWPLKDEGTYPIVPEVFRKVVCSDEPLQVLLEPGAHSYSQHPGSAASPYETYPRGEYRCSFCNAPAPQAEVPTLTE